MLNSVLPLVVCHDFKRGDEFWEGESLIIVAVEATNPAVKIMVVNIRCKIKVQKETPQVIPGYLAVTELIDSSENRENRIVELIY